MLKQMDPEFVKLLERSGAVAAVFIIFHYRMARMEKTIEALPCATPKPMAKTRHKLAMRCLLVFAFLAVLMSGCARFAVDMEEIGADGMERKTKSRVVVWGDAKQTMEQMKLSHGKTQSIGAGGIEQAASATNAVAALDSLRRILELTAKP